MARVAWNKGLKGFGAFNKGRKHSVTSKFNMSESHKGNILTGEQKEKIKKSMIGKNTWMKGRKLSEETKEKISFSQSNSRHYGWKGGRDSYNSRQAKIRDDYTCQICGMREPEIMQVDHIKPKSLFPELRHEMNNLMTLCPNCHARKTIREKKTKNI